MTSMGEIELIEKKYQVLWKIAIEEAQKHSLGWKMLDSNEIPGFLSFDYYYVDNEIQFFYGYASFQRMEEYFKIKDGDFDTIFFICKEILKILEKGQEYLLDFGGCLLLPEWIFWNRHEKKVKICFLPGKEGDVKKEYTTLVEYLMQHADHSDEKLVAMIYGLYDRLALASENFSSEQLLQYLQEFSDQNVTAVPNKNREVGGAGERDRPKECLQKKAREKQSVKSSNTNTGKYYSLEPYYTNNAINLVKCLLNGQAEGFCSIGAGELVVGREESSDFYIPFCEISHRHAVLTNEAEGLFIMDTASRNGTYVNGNKISAYVKTSCKENDVITFADISYKIRRN